MKITTRSRLILLVIAVVLSPIVGVVSNYIWYFFHAVILGWGDSCPDWYFKIQDKIQNGIFATSAVFTVIGLQYWYTFRIRKTNKAHNQEEAAVKPLFSLPVEQAKQEERKWTK